MPDDPERGQALEALAQELGVEFHDLDLLDRALTHASVACEAEARECADYEALEFLGDAALGLAVAHYLYENAPEHTPGEYSRMRAAVVNRRTLARLAKELNIGAYIRLGKGEEQSGGRTRAALLEDCLEALIGALYLDQDWAAVQSFVHRVFGQELERARNLDRVWDFKSRLQHYCQAQRIPLPEFVVVRSEGPDHRKEFEVEVLLRDEPVGRGSGTSKKEAEQNAAREALEHEKNASGQASSGEMGAAPE
jgi:ribonuclease-3